MAEYRFNHLGSVLAWNFSLTSSSTVLSSKTCTLRLLITPAVVASGYGIAIAAQVKVASSILTAAAAF